MSQQKSIGGELDAIVADINSVLAQFNILDRLTLGRIEKIGNVFLPGKQEIYIDGKYVLDGNLEGGKLSKLVEQKLWPSISSIEVLHFTTRYAAEKILKTPATLHLSSLWKRYREHEVEAFFRDHGLTRYLEDDGSGNPRYQSDLLPNIFYASFADVNLTPENQKPLWEYFGGGDGARLRLRIQATNSNFRRMMYAEHPAKPIPLLVELSSAIKKYNKTFILNGISSLCAFYLPASYHPEAELRIVQVVPKGYDKMYGIDRSGSLPVMGIPLDGNEHFGFSINVLEIVTDGPINVPSPFNSLHVLRPSS